MRTGALFLAAIMATALVVASGVAIAATISCPNRSGPLCVGTNNKDTMTGKDNRSDKMRAKGGSDKMRGRGRADVMLGQAGNDTILGQDGPDKLGGGPGRDTLAGGEGRDELAGAEGADALNGGGDDDTYDFRINNWGKDTLTDTSASDNDLFTGNFAQFGFPNGLTTRLTIHLTSSASRPEVSNTGSTSTVNWANDAIDGVYVNTIADNTITGNAAANELNSKGGADSDDTISSGAGNDRISVMDGAGGDTVDCGADEDTVFFDGGDTVTNCERQNPA